jgi:mannose-6-phosphate isomerase-like protein (cupin superfamily)
MLAESGETGGHFAVWETNVPPHFPFPNPPLTQLHWHKITHEAFYVLEGALTFQLGDQSVKAPAGSFVHIPPGVLHVFSNCEAAPARGLVFISPPALSPREYVAAMTELANAGPPNPEELAAVGAKHDTYTPLALTPWRTQPAPAFPGEVAWGSAATCCSSTGGVDRALG